MLIHIFLYSKYRTNVNPLNLKKKYDKLYYGEDISPKIEIFTKNLIFLKGRVGLFIAGLFIVGHDWVLYLLEPWPTITSPTGQFQRPNKLIFLITI